MLKKLLFTSSIFIFSGIASAAQYYDCSVDTGCKAINDVNVTSDYAKTQYPIVLGHGALFTSQVAGIEWWYGIPEALTKNGASVYSVEQSSLNSSYVRGEQIKTQIDDILAATGKEKVNLMGHSHGGQSGRYVVAVQPESVASLTTIGTPHKGSDVADLIQRLTVKLGEKPTDFIANLLNKLASAFNFFSGDKSTQHTYAQNSLATLAELNTSGAITFNQKFPAGIPASECGEGAYETNTIKLYSWSGSSTFNHLFDPLDYVMALTGTIFKGKENDGLSGRCSSHFGKVIRDNYRMNHADQINQLLGMVAKSETNPVTVYQQQANRLKNAGL